METESNYFKFLMFARISTLHIREALLGVLGIRYIYPKYFRYKVLVNI